MKNNYKIIHYYSEEDKLYLCFAPELPGCFADGKTREEAFANIDIVIDEWIETAKKLSRPIPIPLEGDYISTNPTILDVSKYILEKTGKISTMALEKLTYYCLVWSLVWFDNPIFENKFQAWKNGPVCRELYDVHKHRRTITAMDMSVYHEFSGIEKMIMDSVIEVYGSEDGEFLSRLTHGELPWKQTRGNLSAQDNCEFVITNELIKQAYAYE